MEKRGQVNCYEPWKWFGKEVYTINLANGVTPFMLILGDKEYQSLCYRLRKPVLLEVTIGWYRPTASELSAFPRDMQDHFLNGGLHPAPLQEAISRQLIIDPVRPDWNFEAFQAWCLDVYGRRLSSPIG